MAVLFSLNPEQRSAATLDQLGPTVPTGESARGSSAGSQHGPQRTAAGPSWTAPQWAVRSTDRADGSLARQPRWT
eukprot:2361800-Pyramimonas_sp.AAC.1